MSDLLILNKDLLLSSISVDIFKLHLPNPNVLINDIIIRDDFKTFAILTRELELLSAIMEIKIIQNLDKIKNMVSKVIKTKNILNFNLTKSYSGKMDGEFSKQLIIHKNDLTSEQRQYIKYVCTSNQLSSFYSRIMEHYSDIEITKDNEILFEEMKNKIGWMCKQAYDIKLLLDLNEFYNKPEIYAEYIIWIIELSSLLQLDDYYINTRKFDINAYKYVFWHNLENPNIIKIILSYFNNDETWRPKNGTHLECSYCKKLFYFDGHKLPNIMKGLRNLVFE